MASLSAELLGTMAVRQLSSKAMVTLMMVTETEIPMPVVTGTVKEALEVTERMVSESSLAIS